MELKRIRADDWKLWRDVRLKALADAPDAFYATLEQEQAYDEDRWRDWLQSHGVQIVALEGAEPVGVVGGHLGGEGAELYGMWVAPAARGSGLGENLVREVIGWAAEQGHERLRLWVADDNARAMRFYEKLGFTMADQTWPDPRRHAHYKLMSR